jgi:hypothetical protein
MTELAEWRKERLGVDRKSKQNFSPLGFRSEIVNAPGIG